MTAALSDDDRGKTVVVGSEPIGTVTEVSGGTAHVDVDFARVSEGLRAKLGWWEGDRPYTLDEAAVAAVTATEVRLRDDLL